MKSIKTEGVLVGAWHLRPICARETEYTVRPKQMSPSSTAPLAEVVNIADLQELGGSLRSKPPRRSVLVGRMRIVVVRGARCAVSNGHRRFLGRGELVPLGHCISDELVLFVGNTLVDN